MEFSWIEYALVLSHSCTGRRGNIVDMHDKHISRKYIYMCWITLLHVFENSNCITEPFDTIAITRNLRQ